MSTVQLQLELGDLVIPRYRRGASIQENFAEFHAANPWVLTALEKLTADYIATGARALGIGMLWEVIRWQYVSQARGSVFKANNNFRSRYVRLMLERHPEWRTVFATRDLRAD